MAGRGRLIDRVLQGKTKEEQPQVEQQATPAVVEVIQADKDITQHDTQQAQAVSVPTPAPSETLKGVSRTAKDFIHLGLLAASVSLGLDMLKLAYDLKLSDNRL